ncbi:MAG: Cof-type HAD-IIB family hydrolase, partial [Promicromonosporaceae bacterium]|nr:Cof-type HAD-IIB family hydrolase [Promicromonosporaceae bacterium]
TTDNPTVSASTVWFFGSAAVRGAGSDDSHTIPSQLQRLCNTARFPWRVVNASNYNGLIDEQAIRMLGTLPVEGEDICIFMIRRPGLYDALSAIFPTCDLGQVFARPHSMGEVFWDSSSVNAAGNTAAAQRLFTTLGQMVQRLGAGLAVVPASIASPGNSGEIHQEHITKATGIQAVQDHWGIARSAVIAIGDGLNDLEALAHAGLGIAIEGSPPDLLAVADATTPPPHLDGIAAAFATHL